MKDALSNLYYGNITPYDQTMQRGSEYHNIMKQVARHEEELLARLHDEEKSLFEKFSDAQGKLLTLTACQHWKQGFSLGLRIGIEAVETADGLIL